MLRNINIIGLAQNTLTHQYCPKYHVHINIPNSPHSENLGQELQQSFCHYYGRQGAVEHPLWLVKFEGG